MHSFRTGVFQRRAKAAQSRRGTLRAAASVLLTLVSGIPSGFAQQPSANAPQDKQSSALPAAPAPTPTEPFDLRPSKRDFSHPAADFNRHPWKVWLPTTVRPASFTNSVHLEDLVKDGKIYLSLSDALAIAIETNYDLAIARYNLDIADTDILRAKAGSVLRGVNSGVVSNTLGGGGSTLVAGGGPGGSTGGSGGAGSGVNGIVLSTNGAGPLPENRDPLLAGTIQLERSESPQTSLLIPRAFNNTNTYDFTYNQGFVTGSSLQVGFNNSRTTTTSFFNTYSPELLSSFRATLTQHFLQGFGIYINKRFVYQALNDRRIADAGFRQQILFTVNQVENIYWGLVTDYEDVQAKERALTQSTQLLSDTQKQLQIGTMAPLDVVNAQSTVATDRQALISAQNALKYQQMIIKQAIARNLNDPSLETADVIPTDRVSLDELPEEKQPVEDLVAIAFRQRPELEQAVLTLKNNAITLKGARNGLLPTLDGYLFYGASAVGGALNPNCVNIFSNPPAPCQPIPSVGYGQVLQGLGDSSSPDKGGGFTLNIPIRNRTAQADQARSLLEYRQAELHLEQLHTQIRMQVINAQFALTNDRALVLASRAAHDFAQQSLDAEQKKLRLGASTTANVLQQERNLATAQNNLLAAEAAYAKDRAGLYQTLATTLQHYNISLTDAATGTVTSAPVVPGLVPATNREVAPTTPPPTGR